MSRQNATPQKRLQRPLVAAWRPAFLAILAVMIVTACSSGEGEERPSGSPTPTARPPAATSASRNATPVCERQNERSYLNAWNENLVAIGEASDALSQLFLEFSENPVVLFDDDWRLVMALQLAVLDLASNALLEHPAPASLGGMHAHVREVATNVEAAALLYAEALDEIDADKMDEANALVLEAAPRILDANFEMERICGTSSTGQPSERSSGSVVLAPTPSPTPELPLELPSEVTSGIRALIACAGESEAYWLEHGPPELTPALAQCLSEEMEAAP